MTQSHVPVKRELTNCSPCLEKSVPCLYSTVLDYFRPLNRVLVLYHVQQRVSSRHLHGVQRQVLPRAHHNQSRAFSIWQELSRQEMTQGYAVESRRPLILEEILGPPLFLLRHSSINSASCVGNSVCIGFVVVTLQPQIAPCRCFRSCHGPFLRVR